jgi:hypothetical protein
MDGLFWEDVIRLILSQNEESSALCCKTQLA